MITVPTDLFNIAPKWAEFLESVNETNYKTIKANSTGLNASQHDCCIVGESHGFTNNYKTDIHWSLNGKSRYCPECQEYSNSLYSAMVDIATIKKNHIHGHAARIKIAILNQELAAFCDHYGITHSIPTQPVKPVRDVTPFVQ